MPFLPSVPKSKKPTWPHWKLLQYLGLSLLGIIGCQTPPETVPLRSGPTILPAKFVLNKLLERNKHITNFKSFVRTTISRKGSTQTLKQVFLVKNSRFIRIDTLSIFGYPIVIFIHKPPRTLIYEPKQNRIYRGLDVRQAVERVIGTALDFDETLSLFSGNIPQLENLKLQSSRFDTENKYYQLEMKQPLNQTGFHIEVDARLLVPTRLEKRFDQDLIYRAQWEDYQVIDTYYFAHRFTLSRPSPGETLTIKYKHPELNARIPQSAFELTLEKN